MALLFECIGKCCRNMLDTADIVRDAFGQMFPDVHRELHRVNVMGDVVAIELSIQGTFRGPMETPAGAIQPSGAKVNIPCADFFYMRNGKIERFDCYPALNIMLKQMVVPPDFASAVKRSTQRRHYYIILHIE